jgi:microcystin-dependent protein
VVGEASHQLTVAEMPAHSHPTENVAKFLGAANTAAGSSFGLSSAPLSMNSIGGDGAHNNIQPTIVVDVVIAL